MKRLLLAILVLLSAGSLGADKAKGNLPRTEPGQSSQSLSTDSIDAKINANALAALLLDPQ